MEMADLMIYISVFEKDSRLNVWHFALLTAILQLGYRQGQSGVIKVSRSKLMGLSHIRTLPTYHKYFKELQTMGIIDYRPSYHPGYRSEVTLKISKP